MTFRAGAALLVHCADCHRWIGTFVFSGQFESVTRLRASMDGYVTATLSVDSTASTGAIEFRLEPSVAP